jgi:hypothetical protein
MAKRRPGQAGGDVPSRPSASPDIAKPSSAPLQLPLFGALFGSDDPSASKMRRKPWAWLLRHVFAIDVSVCPECAGTMRWRRVARTPDAIRVRIGSSGALCAWTAEAEESAVRAALASVSEHAPCTTGLTPRVSKESHALAGCRRRCTGMRAEQKNRRLGALSARGQSPSLSQRE